MKVLAIPKFDFCLLFPNLFSHPFFPQALYAADSNAIFLFLKSAVPSLNKD
jgi:hypothetical protein